MVKLVHENSMVRHLWANQSQETARSGNGNLSFKGPILFSYSTPIAAILTAADGSKVALITSRTFSVTTSGKHMPRGDWRGPTFYAPHIPASLSEFNVDYAHSHNLQAFKRDYEEALATYAAERATQPDRLNDKRGLVHDRAVRYARYAALFALVADILPFDADIAAADEKRAIRDAHLMTPAAIAKRAKAQAERAALAAQKAERDLLAQRERHRIARLEAAGHLAAWKEGNLNYIPYEAQTDDNGGAYLRVVDNELQTSQGARVPLAHAIAVFKVVAECKRTGTSWGERDPAILRVGSFKVDRIFENGDFKAGCHRINWSESERIAQTLGLLETV